MKSLNIQEAEQTKATTQPYLFFDTETTGLPRSWREPTSNTENWPHIVQIAWVPSSDAGISGELKNYIIKPEGFTIPRSASKIHGITTKRALAEGVPIGVVLEEFTEAAKRSDLIIAHNMSFDEKMIEVELLRNQMPSKLQGMNKICTMKSATHYCDLPGPYGSKWPTLSELHIKLFATDFQDQHNAAADVSCCAKCFFELKRREII